MVEWHRSGPNSDDGTFVVVSPATEPPPPLPPLAAAEPATDWQPDDYALDRDDQLWQAGTWTGGELHWWRIGEEEAWTTEQVERDVGPLRRAVVRPADEEETS